MKTVSITEFAPVSSTTSPAPQGFRATPAVVDPEMIRALMAKGRVEQARAVRAAFKRLFAGIAALLGGAWSTVTGWRLRRRNLRALNSLDDRMLKDIGLDRGQIAGLVHNSATGFEPDHVMYELKSPANSLKSVIAA